MSDASAIEWTDATWNVVTGCTRVSPGCANCYIERTPPFRIAGRRFERVGNEETTGVELHPERLEQPLKWRKPRRVFVCSLADLFHESVSDAYLAAVFAVMESAPMHTFQVLTKRPERAKAVLTETFYAGAVRKYGRDALGSKYEARNPGWPLPNVWLGVSIENARHTWRADVLREIPAAVRFVSAEPLLGSLFETRSVTPREGQVGATSFFTHRPLDLTGIDWVIAGGESGPGARPMHPDWVRELRDACLYWWKTGAGHKTAFFFKQIGEWLPYWPYADPPFWTTHDGSLYDGHHLPVGLSEGDRVRGRNGDVWWAPDPADDVIYRRVGKKRAGRLLDGREWNEYPREAATPGATRPASQTGHSPEPLPHQDDGGRS